MRGGSGHQHAHAWHLAHSANPLLRAHRERPCGRDAEQRDEVAPLHVWMAPAWQEKIECRTEVACSHVSGLFTQSGWTAGPLSHRLEPAVAAELHVKRGADGNYDADHEEIAVGPLELGHVLEIHPVDSCNGGRYGQDGGPRREPACNHSLLRLPGH